MSRFGVKRRPGQNYFMKNSLAYTEDDVLIFNVFVYNINIKLTESELKVYFAQFGDVKSVRLIIRKKGTRRSGPRVGIVCFVEALSAARALQHELHAIGGQRFHVKACDSWHQPNPDQSCARDVSVYEGPPDKSNFSLLQLNQDCLDYICGKLGIREQICFARVCKRAQIVFEDFARHAYKKFDLNVMDSLTLMQIHDFFLFAGKHIEELKGTVPEKYGERVLEIIRSYCPNLTCLSMCDGKFPVLALRDLLRSLESCTKLRLLYCSLNDRNIFTLCDMKSLEILNLLNNYNISGEYLNKLVQLKELSLFECCNVMSEPLIAAFKALRGLRKLDIRGCVAIEEFVFNLMPVYCTKLEILKMSWPDFAFESVAQLPSLKALVLERGMRQFGISPSRIYIDLVKYKADQLESLTIVSNNTLTVQHIDLISQLKKLKVLYLGCNNLVNDKALRKFADLAELEELMVPKCREISNVGVLHLLRCCKKLRTLNVQMCARINIELIPKAIELMMPRKFEMKQPLSMFGWGTLINEIHLSQIPEYNGETMMYLLKVHSKKVFRGVEPDDQFDVEEAISQDEEEEDLWNDIA